MEAGYSDTGSCCLALEYTWLMQDNPVSNNGTLTYWQVHTSGGNAGIAKLKIFRDNGTDFIYIGESSFISVDINGIFSGSCNIAVLIGDLIGIYIAGNSLGAYHDGSNIYYHTGDIISNSSKGAWGGTNGGISVYANGNIISNVYIDVINGNDGNIGDSFISGHPKQTLSAGYALINTTGTIHAASGTYSKSGIIFNKSWKLSPEDPNSVGYKKVSIGA